MSPEKTVSPEPFASAAPFAMTQALKKQAVNQKLLTRHSTLPHDFNVSPGKSTSTLKFQRYYIEKVVLFSKFHQILLF